MRAVNLIPLDRRGTRSASALASLFRSPMLVLAIVVAIAVVAGVVVEARSAASTVTARQQTLRDLDAQVAKLPKPSSTGITSRLSIVTTVADQRTTWDGFLSAVSKVIPEDVWLLNLSASTSSGTTSAVPSAPAVTAPTDFTITGYTYTQPSVARLMRRLRLVPWLSNVSLTTSSKTNVGEHFLYQFTLGANVISLPEVGS